MESPATTAQCYERAVGTKTRIPQHHGRSTWKMAKELRSDKRPLPPIHSANNGIVFTDEDKAAAFAHSLENQCQTNIDPDADDEHLDLVEETVEEIRWAEPTISCASVAWSY
ncbi:hypothetical protein Zmor_028349 [Zophobas morio]|uniref:Uncharacterized protein n=1 Tax=Zophobas morio TaxID=2755281 RepID=A0AA38HVC6_9CUCU|nr:hypothetical protein Zmor_028349 [Zophobas morio]